MARELGAVSIVAMVLGGSSCLPPPAESASGTAHTQSEAQTDGKAVVKIVGPIAFIDGKRISRIGHPIKGWPCGHVVRTDKNFVTSNKQVTVWGTVTPVDFVLPIREGYNYYIERQILDTSSETSPVRFTAYEREASGNVVQEFSPTR